MRIDAGGILQTLLKSFLPTFISVTSAKTVPKGHEFRATKVAVVRALGRRFDISILATTADEPKP